MTTSAGPGLTGILSGTGPDIVRATVYTANVPAVAPVELADSVHPVYANSAELQDWRFGSPTLGQHVDDATWPRFRQWRASFAQDRFLGERALIRSFPDWLEPRCAISALSVLRLPSGHVDFHGALTMKMQIEGADRAVHAAHQDGIGLYTANARSAMRVLIPTQPPALLLGLNQTALRAGLEGITLQVPNSPSTLRGITGWRSDEGSVVVSADGGEVDVTGQDAATLLRVAGRQAPGAQVRQAPLRTLLAPLLVFLRDAATLAGRVRADLHFWSGHL